MADPHVAHHHPFDFDGPPGTVPALDRLPVGRHGLPREFVKANQRRRLLAAALDVFGRRGYAEASIAEVIRLAGVSRHTYYDHFADKEACLLATHDAAVDWLTDRLSDSLAAGEGWARGVVEVVGSLADHLSEDRRLARLLTVEMPCAGAAARARHDADIDRLADGLAPGHATVGPSADLPAGLDRLLVAGAVSVVARRVKADGGGVTGLVHLAAELSEILLAPYIGLAAARDTVVEFG